MMLTGADDRRQLCCMSVRTQQTNYNSTKTVQTSASPNISTNSDPGFQSRLPDLDVCLISPKMMLRIHCHYHFAEFQ